MKRFFIPFILSVTCLTACAPVLVGSAAIGGTSLLVDRRTVGDSANDGVIEAKSSLLLTQANLSSSHITSTSYEGRLLLSGEVGTQEDKDKAEEIAKTINGVTAIYNELAVADNSSLTTRMNDSVIVSKIRAALLDNAKVTLTSLKVVVEQGVAYLTGTVTQAEADSIISTTQKVRGVTKVVNLLHIISEQELKKRQLSEPDRSSTETTGPTN